jgi:hypothetical protein
MIHAGSAEPIRRLEELGRELAARGWFTSLRATGDHPARSA